MLFQTLSAESIVLVADALPVRVFWKDRESRFLGCNKLFAEDAGISDRSSFVGKTDFYFYHAEQARAFRIDDAQVMASGVSKLGIIEELTLENGETRWLETNKVPLRDENGRIVGILGTYHYVSEPIGRAIKAA